MKQLPASLPLPVGVSVRNADLNVNEHGLAARLDESGLVAVFPIAIPDGTVLFTTIDMRAINQTARGLVRVASSRDLGEGAGFETVAEFVELNDDGKQKLQRLLAGSGAARPREARSLASDQLGLQPVYQRDAPGNKADYQVTDVDKRSYFEPSPIRAHAVASPTTKFWGSLGLVAYLIAFLLIVAVFPRGRAIELATLSFIVHGVAKLWYWANHIGQVNLFNNT